MTQIGFNGVPFHDCYSVSTKACVVCGSSFRPRSGVNKFCSTSCRGRWKYITGAETTGTQYKRISGNWERYASRLLQRGGRKHTLSREVILRVLESQGYKCALTGVPLTCHLEVGNKSKTNASIDRIVPGGPYTEENIQIVCRAVNCFRSDLTVDEFVEWCEKVVKHAKA